LYVSGHYYGYCNPKCDNHWYCFDDTDVKDVTPEEVISNNFGLKEEENGDDDVDTASAYMLIYVRTDLIERVQLKVTEDDIPPNIKEAIVGLLKTRMHVCCVNGFNTWREREGEEKKL
jgi:hypothetical protein